MFPYSRLPADLKEEFKQWWYEDGHYDFTEDYKEWCLYWLMNREVQKWRKENASSHDD